MAFLNPAFLWALAAVSIPIALHFFELRRPKRLAFSNVEFIRQVKLVSARQRRLKEWLVLLCRIGVVTMLVLLFAQPYWPAPGNTSGQEQGALDVLVDTSPSMQAAAEGEQTAFEQATSQARDLPTAVTRSARFSLINRQPASLAAPAYRAAVDALRPGQSSASLTNLVNRRATVGADAKPVFVFSDFQRNDFPRQALTELAQQVPLFLVPVGSTSTHNVFVDSVMLDDAFVRAGTDLAVRVRVRNGGNVAVNRCRVSVLVGKRLAASFQVAVPAGGVAEGTAKIQVTERTTQQCRVVIDDYPVDFDNTYYFTLTPSPQIGILDYSASALPATQRLYSNESLFTYQHLPRPSSLPAATRLILVQELPQPEAQIRSQLRQVLARGGSAVIVPPADVRAHEAYNQLFRELGVGPVQWLETPANPGAARQEVAVPSRQNPFFREVFAGANRNVGMPVATPVLRWSRSSQEVLRFRSGDGFLGGFRSGRGMVYVLASPLSGDYTDFARHALFVPVMYRLAMQSLLQTLQPAYRMSEGTIELPAPARSSQDQVLTLVQDSLRLIPAQRTLAGTLRLEIPPGMQRPGFYTLQQGTTPVATLAFNFDKPESVLAHYSAAELKQLWAGQKNVQVYEAGQGTSVAAQYRAGRVGTPLWQYCVWAALFFLLAEVALLRWPIRARAVPTA